MVTKLGMTTDLTVERANSIFSFTRYYDDQGVVGIPWSGRSCHTITSLVPFLVQATPALSLSIVMAALAACSPAVAATQIPLM